MTALWKRNSLLMCKYLKEELFSTVKILKGNPAPTANNERSASKGDRQRLKQSASCWENYLELRGWGGGVFMSVLTLKKDHLSSFSLGFSFWSPHPTKHHLFWMRSMRFLKRKSCENLHKHWAPSAPLARPFVSIWWGWIPISYHFVSKNINHAFFRSWTA